MISVRGIYDGQTIRPLEHFDVPPNVEVIITFMKYPINQSIIKRKSYLNSVEPGKMIELLKKL
jgi:hypothetical protein